MKRVLAALVALVSTACGSDERVEQAPAPAEPGLTTSTADIGPLHTESGDEATNCIYKRLDNAEAGYVRRVRGSLTEGSHHMIVYLAEEQAEQLEPQPCGGFEGLFVVDENGVPGLDNKNVPIFIVQQKNAELVLPKDNDVPLGFKIEKNQMLFIELHWYNPTAKARDVSGHIELDLLPEDQQVIETSFGFWGTDLIDIPPKSEAKTPVLFQKALADTKAFAVTTHQHQLGSRMRVWNANTAGDPVGEPLVENTNWAEPALALLSPPLSFEFGQGLAYQCEWSNPTNRHVDFGESVDDEMCFLWLYYYPSRGFDICIQFNASATTGICNHLVR